MKKTPLHPIHKELGAKMISFAGWEMPVQYNGIIEEHLATREKAGLFDISHMGELVVSGNDATEFLDYVTCNDITKIQENQVQYNAIVNEKGGVVDDVTIYKIQDNHYFICSNAANFSLVYEHFLQYNQGKNVTIKNQSTEWHQIAIQGPLAEEIISDYFQRDFSNLGYYRFTMFPDTEGMDMIISRTGYTGEDGFEIYTSIPTGIKLWKDLLGNYKDKGLVPVGLGARDTLRIEAKYSLYGHELSQELTPVESGISWIVKEKLNPYLGYNRIMKDKKEGPSKTIVGMELVEPGVLREGYPVMNQEHIVIGKITSGTYSPCLKKSIGLALIQTKWLSDSEDFLVDIRGSAKKAKLHLKPFVQGSVKKRKL